MSADMLESSSTAESINVDDSNSKSEVKSGVEEYFEYFEIDGIEYRRKMTKRTVVEKIKSQQILYAPLMSDGLTPDLSKINVIDGGMFQTDNIAETPEPESFTDVSQYVAQDLDPSLRSNEGRFHVKGYKFLPCQDDIKKVSRTWNIDSLNPHSYNSPDLLASYMYRFGQSDFEVPPMDSRLSTQLHDEINFEWFNTKHVDLPHEKSKSLSYFKKTFQKNEDGKTVINILEKTKSRTRRFRLDNNVSQASITNDHFLSTPAITNVTIENGLRDSTKSISDEDFHSSYRVPQDLSIVPKSISSNNNSSKSQVNILPDSTDQRQSSTNCSSLHSFILMEDNPRPYLIFDDDAKLGECDIAGGPVDALIVHACDGKEHILFLGAFLDTYRTFITPEDLIDRLIIRFKFYHSKISIGEYNLHCSSAENNPNCGNLKSESPDDDPRKKCIHILSLLLTIIGKLKRDFTDAIKTQIKLFQQYIIEIKEEKWISTIDNTITTLTESMDKDNEVVQRLNNLSSMPSSDIKIKSPKKRITGMTGYAMTMHDFPSKEIAEQMTLLDWAKYRDVELIEVLNMKDIAKCNLPGVIEYAKHFQNVQHWTQSILLAPNKRTADRDKDYLKFCRIMKHLRELNSFSSFIAILLGIQLLPIKKLFSKKIQSKIQETEDYMKPTRFIGYKEDLKNATAPCIPFLGLFYQDIVMLNIGNSQYLNLDEVANTSTNSNWTSNNNHQLLSSITNQSGPIINFWRSFKQYQFLKNCNKDQDKIRYSIQPNEKILKFLANFQCNFDDCTLQNISKKR